MAKMRFTHRALARTALLLALTLTVQAIRLPSVVTGPLVNYILLLSTILAGIAGGVFIGAVTPWVAVAVGILPFPLAPAVPFIMLGNAAYCLIFGLLDRDRWRSWVGIVPASLIKFAIITGAVQLILDLPAALTRLLMLPQLFNALLGGAAAKATGLYLKNRLETGQS